MVGSARSLLLQASKEVQVADQLFDVVYPLSNDPKVLLNVVRHACRARDLAGEARGEPVRSRFHELLALHARAATAFSRNDRVVLADDGFASLETLSPAEVAAGMAEAKRVVHDAGRKVIAHD